jgi:hypothetical protein
VAADRARADRPGELFAAGHLLVVACEPLALPLDLRLSLGGVEVEPGRGVLGVRKGEQDEAHASVFLRTADDHTTNALSLISTRRARMCAQRT